MDKKARTQRKVVNEAWADERLAAFLALPAFGKHSQDYSILYKAYTSMTVEHFERFIPLFVADGRDLRATSSDGLSIAELIQQHNKGQPYLDVLSRYL